ncbi:3-oxoadipate enol-lactonase [Cribrihabitans neustonicus]|uniref:3-oxoadipate enol-lactonase n=1 Tax=Cribrihabitans neustonicus TaxID=1429085 RepID=UPI003B5CCE32
MPFVTLDGTALHYRLIPGTGRPVVFLNSLGTDFRIWDGVISRLELPSPVLCMDKRGHGLSDEGPASIALLARDAAALMVRLGLSGGLICGVSVGGMIAQALAAQRPDLAAGLVLCNTGAKIGDAESWNARINAVLDHGIAAIAEGILERWFSAGFRAREPAALAGYRNMLTRTPPRGYAAVCGAIRDSDFSHSSANLTLPALCIAGSEDQATPPEVVEALARIIPGAGYRLIEGCGHLPCIEAPDTVAQELRQLYRQLA